MQRRHILQFAAAFASGGLLSQSAAPGLAQQATPAMSSSEDVDGTADHHARELIDRLAAISPLALLEALETSEVTEPALIDFAPSGSTVEPAAWSDPSDTDLEHALGGVLLATDNQGINNPDSVFIGGYIVFETPGIAYDQLMRSLGDDPNYPSMTAAGTKVWLIEDLDGDVGVMRLGNVIAIATDGQLWSRGVMLHLDTVARSLV